MHDWINALPRVEGTKASVISVSAGGEAKSNRTCRNVSIKSLESKGFVVDYEKMVTMPSNYGFTAPNKMNELLIKAAPITSDAIAEDIASGKELRNEKTRAIIWPILAKAFKKGSRGFGRSLRTTDDCTDCKWCQDNCPTKNLTIEDGKISAEKNCVWCMRCVYGCPVNALESKNLSFSVLDDGFSIKKIQKSADNTDIQEAMKDLTDAKSWKGTVEYLKEVFGK